jgi:DNA-binding transcriptional MerR regulator
MKPTPDVYLTIEALGEAVAAALEEGYDGPPNARVRDVPDQRTIRYYTTLGLIDRAIEMRGRTALYGRRHVLQLVAIKKLQARGMSLAQIQQALLGQADTAIAKMAGMKPGQAASKPAPESIARRTFWKERPAESPSLQTEGPRAERSREESADGRAEPPEGIRRLEGVQLAENVTLLVGVSRPLEEHDLAALRAAARPLIEVLTKLKIVDATK